MPIISILTGKAGKYILLALALGAAWFMLSTHYINVGKAECQAKVTAADTIETTRLKDAHIEALKKANETVEQLKTKNIEISRELTNAKKANEDESDNACYSVNRLRGINTIRAK